MPLNPADPSYLSFEKMVLPVAVERGMGIQGMKSTAQCRAACRDPREGLSRPTFSACRSTAWRWDAPPSDRSRMMSGSRSSSSPCRAEQMAKVREEREESRWSAPGKLETRYHEAGIHAALL